MSVLVLEAGGSADKLEIRAPLGTGALHNLQDKQDLVDWKYRSNDGAITLESHAHESTRHIL